MRMYNGRARNNDTLGPPQLAYACKQIQHEVFSLYYGRKIFLLSSDYENTDVLGRKARSLRPYVRSVRYFHVVEIWVAGPDLMAKRECNIMCCASMRRSPNKATS